MKDGVLGFWGAWFRSYVGSSAVVQKARRQCGTSVSTGRAKVPQVPLQSRKDTYACKCVFARGKNSVVHVHEGFVIQML